VLASSVGYLLTGDVAQKLLPFRRREFGDPMVLASCSGCPVRSAACSLYRGAAPESHIEAISASESTTKNMPTQTARKSQMAPAVPPFNNERLTMLRSRCQ
jgi:hypothetical protein